MKRIFYTFFVVFLMIFSSTGIFAQQKYALVIGNGGYTGSGMTKLANPVNDANDVAAALQGLGFTVDKVLDATLDQMESAIMRLKNRLSVSNDAYGFFFYAGHGVQSGGENYLIPVGANIPSENSLRDRAVSVQWALAELNEANNALNVVVLDACRDNPFAWKRSGTRGLSVVSNQPADSIIVFATSAGSTAADGVGRNGLFTTYLLNNLKTPGLAVDEVFKRTGADVARASNRTQIPAVYNQFFDTAYFGSKPQVAAATQPSASTPATQPAATTPAVTQPAPASTPAAQTSSTSNSNEFISRTAGWGVNCDDKSSSSYSIEKEQIDGREWDVLTVNINLAAGKPRWAGVLNYNNNFVLKLKNANGARFKVLGDGKKWLVYLALSTVTDSAFHRMTISTQNGRVTAVDVPFRNLKQPDWGKKIEFNKYFVTGIAIERQDNMDGTGLSFIKIFDFEFY
ncbi:hypothetical protein R84B8_02224 [Treponema sp. R8-4-B8]